VFGYGIAYMANSIGAHVKTVILAYNQTIQGWKELDARMRQNGLVVGSSYGLLEG
jgi:hypothetical protein